MFQKRAVFLFIFLLFSILSFSQEDKTVIPLKKILNTIAKDRKQTLAQMAIAWLLKDNRITSVLVGASSVDQLSDNLESLNKVDFSDLELKQIEIILKS